MSLCNGSLCFCSVMLLPSQQWGSILRARSLVLRNAGLSNAGLYRQRRMQEGLLNSLLFLLLYHSDLIKAAQNCLVPRRLPSNSPAQKTGGHSEH